MLCTLFAFRYNTGVFSDLKFPIMVICCFTFSAVLFFITMLISRTYKSYRGKKISELRKKFELLITSVIFEEDWLQYENVRQREKLVHHFAQHYLREKNNNQILIDEIVNLYKNIAGKPAENLRNLYMVLGLENESSLKLKSRHWHIRAKGIAELAQMNIRGGYEELYKVVNSKNLVLREKAQLALVKLFNFDALGFLDNSDYPISEWQQINILSVLSSMQGGEAPDFSRWLASKNESVVIFALKMISHFNCLDLMQQVTETLNHPSPRVRKMALNTIEELK